MTGLADDVFPLPYTCWLLVLVLPDHWDFVLNSAGNIRVPVIRDTAPWSPELGGISFRYVIVPGGVAGWQDA